MRKDLYVSEEATPKAVQAGWAELLSIVDEAGVSTAWIVGDTTTALSGIVEGVLGNRAAALQKGQPVQIGRSCRLVFYTSRTLPMNAAGVAILACLPSSKLLDKLDNLRNASALIVVPFRRDEIQPWIEARAPRDVLGQEQPNMASITNPTLLRAMQSIWSRINTNTGLAHPRDRDAVIDAFRILKHHKVEVRSDEVRAYLVQKGMKSQDANEIAAVAADPSRFRRRNSQSSWASNIFRQWSSKD